MAKLVEFNCPRCDCHSMVPEGMIDVSTGEIVPLTCPKCGLTLDFES